MGIGTSGSKSKSKFTEITDDQFLKKCQISLFIHSDKKTHVKVMHFPTGLFTHAEHADYFNPNGKTRKRVIAELRKKVEEAE